MVTGRILTAIGLLLGILPATPTIAQTPPNLIEEVLPNGLEVTILPTTRTRWSQHKSGITWVRPTKRQKPEVLPICLNT